MPLHFTCEVVDFRTSSAGPSLNISLRFMLKFSDIGFLQERIYALLTIFCFHLLHQHSGLCNPGCVGASAVVYTTIWRDMGKCTSRW